MLKLHQFRHSPFCHKVRMTLKVKELPCEEIDVIPGLGQFALFKLSGQRQAPVLVDGQKVFSDSSVIVRYLETLQPEPALIPGDLQQATQIHLIEDWADKTLASSVRSALLEAAAIDSELRNALLPEDLPSPMRQLMGELPCGFLSGVSELFTSGERSELLASLLQLSRLVEVSGWLVGQSMTIADLAVAAQLSLLVFPKSSGPCLAGKGCPGFMDHPGLQKLFVWRDELEYELFKFDIENKY